MPQQVLRAVQGLKRAGRYLAFQLLAHLEEDVTHALQVADDGQQPADARSPPRSPRWPSWSGRRSPPTSMRVGDLLYFQLVQQHVALTGIGLHQQVAQVAEHLIG